MHGPEELARQVYLVVDELRGAANLAKYFAADVYERERADHIRLLAARLASLVDPAPQESLRGFFTDDTWARVSPVVGVEAAVLNPDGELLLCRRRDDDRWCLPGGISEVGQSTTEAALRELWEEAGLRGEVVRLLGLFDGARWRSASKAHLIHLLYEVRCESFVPAPGIEMTATAFFAADALPEAMHPGHEIRAALSLELIRSGRTHHDPSSTLEGEMPMHQRPPF